MATISKSDRSYVTKLARYRCQIPVDMQAGSSYPPLRLTTMFVRQSGVSGYHFIRRKKWNVLWFWSNPTVCSGVS
jgi:hypothetical protein